MKKTLLKFSSAVYLIAFRKYSKASYWEINLTDLTVICDCSEKEARAASTDFKATRFALNEDSQPMANVIGGLSFAQEVYPIMAEKAS